MNKTNLQFLGRPVAVKRYANARYMRAKIAADGSIVVSLPRRARISHTEILAFLESGKDQLEAMIHERDIRRLVHKQSQEELLSAGLWFHFGKTIKILPYQARTKSEQARFDEAAAELRLPVKKLHDLAELMSKVKNWQQEEFEMTAQTLFAELLQKQSWATGATLYFREMKTRWGSCTPKTRRIRINYRLCQYSHEALYAVICHELCHIKVPGHGPDFYQLLYKLCPHYEDAIAELKASHFDLY